MNQESGWKVVDGSPQTAYIVDQDNWDVALVSRGKTETAISRARVMAVAPEMARLLADYYVAHTDMARYFFADMPSDKQCQCDLCQRWRALLARIEGEG